jgi:hypothetical protein
VTQPIHIRPAAALLALTLLASAIGSPVDVAAQQNPTGFPATCQPGEVQVMLLGTYHFEGSGRDAVVAPAADVLTPQRQAELDDLAARLARWAPEQITVEWPLSYADTTTAMYQRYRAAGTSRDPNEVVQIGFRLARRLGHPTVYPIDHQMRLGNDSIEALMTRRPEFQRRSDSLLAVMQAQSDSVQRHHAADSIVRRLRDANTDEGLHGGNSFGMFGSYLAAGEGYNLGGPQVLARWYERNIIMAHNLTRVLRPETRRVLVIVGSGHVPPIRNVLDESPDFCPVSPLPYLQ